MTALWRVAFLPAVLLLHAATPPDAAAQQSSRTRGATARATTIRAELAGVLLQSKRYDDAAREYSMLVAMDPRNRSYRLGLARSLAWGRRLREAERELLALRADYPEDTTIESLLDSVREAIDPGSHEASTWLAQRPGSLPYRRMLARALAREERTIEALAQYDTILGARPTPDLFIERAYVHLERRDFGAAERDVYESVSLGATPGAYILLGDLHRWRGDFGGARSWYVRARVMRPDAPEVAAAFGRLAREQRPPVAFIPNVGEPDSWETTNTTTSDNLGVNFTTLTLRRGLMPRSGFDVSAGVRVVSLIDRDPVLGGGEQGFGADVAASRETTHKQFYARARARAGFMSHPSAGISPEGALALAAFAGAWGVGAEISSSVAYPSLMTLATLRPLPENGALLREQSSAISVAGPLRRADVGARHQSTSLSDGNTRTALQGYARLPLNGTVAALYSGNTQSFAVQSPLYWSPERYVGHAIGLELASRRMRGRSLAAQVLPGVAWTTELDEEGDRIHRSAAQLSGGIEMSYRTLKWQVGGGATYGRGRAGDYERFDALLYARYLP
jgi:tetratricopeptide repeat protein